MFVFLKKQKIKNYSYVNNLHIDYIFKSKLNNILSANFEELNKRRETKKDLKNIEIFYISL